MTIDNFLTLGMLILLQAVLGLDNLLYISLESKNAPEEKRRFVRNMGIGLAIILRIALLFILLKLIVYFQNPIFNLNFEKVITGEFNIHCLIVYLGGGFIMYTAIKEIWRLISNEDLELESVEKKKSTGKIIFMIVIMNLVFSFDSILSAIALTQVFWVQAVAIVIGGVLMIWLSDKVSKFLQKNKMFEVLGLFILLLVGVMLLTEAGHLSHLHLFGQEITPMNKATFYFVIVVLILVDTVQTRYKKKLRKIIQIEKKSDTPEIL
jgi:predicted tellurium resistance membrane protein TerC